MVIFHSYVNVYQRVNSITPPSSEGESLSTGPFEDIIVPELSSIPPVNNSEPNNVAYQTLSVVVILFSLSYNSYNVVPPSYKLVYNPHQL